ncbi:MAG: hypothetical protein RIQ50_1632 [Bacteroidota bacterium]|jgi:hypothetical protein
MFPNDLIRHTSKLLHHGIFSHLTDEKITKIHHLLLKNSDTDVFSFFGLWRQGDFSFDFSSLQLLLETNLLLQKYGQPHIESDFLMELFD